MIDLEQARGLLARAVMTQGPDFRYANRRGLTCQYEPLTYAHTLEDEEPDDPRRKTGCLIGTAGKLAGLDVSDWTGTFSGSVVHDNPGLFGPGVAQYWQTAQSAQDAGDTWGEAFDKAELSLVDDE